MLSLRNTRLCIGRKTKFKIPSFHYVAQCTIFFNGHFGTRFQMQFGLQSWSALSSQIKFWKFCFIINLSTGMQTVRWEVIIDSKSRYVKLRVLAPGYQRIGTPTPCCRVRLVAWDLWCPLSIHCCRNFYSTLSGNSLTPPWTWPVVSDSADLQNI